MVLLAAHAAELLISARIAQEHSALILNSFRKDRHRLPEHLNLMTYSPEVEPSSGVRVFRTAVGSYGHFSIPNKDQFDSCGREMNSAFWSDARNGYERRNPLSFVF